MKNSIYSIVNRVSDFIKSNITAIREADSTHKHIYTFSFSQPYRKSLWQIGCAGSAFQKAVSLIVIMK